MKPINFPEQNAVFAEDQPEYTPLPAHHFFTTDGKIAFCWGLTWRERLRVLLTGRIWHEVMTFSQPLQPQMLMVEKPNMRVRDLAAALAHDAGPNPGKPRPQTVRHNAWLGRKS